MSFLLNFFAVFLCDWKNYYREGKINFQKTINTQFIGYRVPGRNFWTKFDFFQKVSLELKKKLNIIVRAIDPSINSEFKIKYKALIELVTNSKFYILIKK